MRNKFLFAAAAVALTATAALAATHHHHKHPPLASYVSGERMNYALLAPEQTGYVQTASMDQMMAVMSQMQAAMAQQMQQAFADGDDMVPTGEDRLMNTVLTGPPDEFNGSMLDAALKSGHACVQSVSIIERAGEKAQVSTHIYGACGVQAGAVSGTDAATPAVRPLQPGLIEARLLMPKGKHGHHPA